jgi:hypothetical protein
MNTGLECEQKHVRRVHGLPIDEENSRERERERERERARMRGGCFPFYSSRLIANTSVLYFFLPTLQFEC